MSKGFTMPLESCNPSRAPLCDRFVGQHSRHIDTDPPRWSATFCKLASVNWLKLIYKLLQITWMDHSQYDECCPPNVSTLKVYIFFILLKTYETQTRHWHVTHQPHLQNTFFTHKPVFIFSVISPSVKTIMSADVWLLLVWNLSFVG
jgi:hypothetical protein